MRYLSVCQRFHSTTAFGSHWLYICISSPPITSLLLLHFFHRAHHSHAYLYYTSFIHPYLLPPTHFSSLPASKCATKQESPPPPHTHTPEDSKGSSRKRRPAGGTDGSPPARCCRRSPSQSIVWGHNTAGCSSPCPPSPSWTPGPSSSSACTCCSFRSPWRLRNKPAWC